MSVSRARAYLHEIETVAHPSLTIDRSIETFGSDCEFFICLFSVNYGVKFIRLMHQR